jgi:molybdate transport system substrate-binding protein
MSNLRVLAPGSMTHLMPRLLDLYLQTNSASINTNYGPSGSLRAKIESGAEFDLYLSASTTHTRDLMQLGWLKQTDILGFNSMVLLYQSELKVTPSTVIQTLIDPRISVGMSTTGLDPSRDYAIEVLQKVSDISGVTFEHIEKKTRMITGGRETPNAPPGRNQYGRLMETENVQVLLTYLSNALAAIEDNANISFTELPETIAVTATYAIGLANTAPDQAHHLYQWLIDMDARRILKDGGFIPVHERS